MKTFQTHRLILACTSALTFAAVTPTPLSAQLPAPVAPPVVTAGDAKAFDAAETFFRAQQWKEAVNAFEKFLETYKMQSPKSLDAKFHLAVAYVQVEDYVAGVKSLKELIGDKKVEPAAKEVAQLLIAKSLTLQGFKMPAESPVQKGAQKKFLEIAVKEYDAFLASFPQSKDGDSANFLRASLLVTAESFDEAIKGFSVVVQRFPATPLRWDAVMWIGKCHFINANKQLETKGAAEPKPEAVKSAMESFDKAQPVLAQVVQNSSDVALANEAIFYIGQMQLTRSQHVEAANEEETKKRGTAYTLAALDAFRAVRSVEEVITEQQAKIKRIEALIPLLQPGTADYLPLKSRYEGLIAIETDKIDGYKRGRDQYLDARLAITRIFLLLSKPDECRTLVRYLQGQTELLAKDKDAQANIGALLCLTYLEQKNLAKGGETYEAFRGAFKGNESGDNLALLLANLFIDAGQADKAEEIVNQGAADYKDWRFAGDATRILISVALKRGDFPKALTLADKVLAANPKPDVEADTLFLKGSVQQATANEKHEPAMAAAAIASYKLVRDKFPANPKSEDAWFATAQILSGTDAAKAVTELQFFVDKFSGGSGKSENTKLNVATAQYLLGRSLEATGAKDKAVEAYRKVIEKYSQSDAAPGAFFKIFDIQNAAKDYPACVKTMQDFLEKYPAHDNVYFAYTNIAEFLYTGSLNVRKGPDGKVLPNGAATIADIEAGSKKLMDFVDYELAKDLKMKRGESALIKIEDRWIKEVSKLPNFMTLNDDQKIIWQKGVEAVTAAVEKQIKSYPTGERLGEGLERLVAVQSARLKSQQTKASDVEAYFNKLVSEAPGDAVKAKILAALAAFLQDSDPKHAATILEKAFQILAKSTVDKDGKPEASFTPQDYDRRLAGLFETKQTAAIAAVVQRVREEYPLDDKDDTNTEKNLAGDAQAIALFWEGKVLGEQGKVAEAAAKFAELSTKFPKSTKKMEADYGVILGKVEAGKLEPEFVKQLTDIVKVTNTKTFDLQAKALFLIGRIYEQEKDYDNAIDTYLKIHTRYEAVPKISGDGLWKGSQLLEKQSKGEIPVKTIAERAAAAKEKAAAAAAAKAKEAPKPAEAAAKPDAAKPAAPAAKPAPAKP